jgi:UDP-4-amino-4,6-dideoxy-N-acetyl-beta-L-altrosamine transaminase
MKQYPYNKQKIYKEDIRSIEKILKSNYITQGPIVKKFEKSISSYVNSKYTSATNSATSALHIACLSLGLKSGDELWTVPNSFVASSNCGVYCGAKIDFVDIDEKHFNIDVSKLESKLKKKTPKILVTVHLGGQPPIQEKIWKLAKKYNFFVIEDASHALGASRKSVNVGSCKWSDITVFSFHPVKMITTGEGGAATTNSKKIYKKMELLKNHGITRDQKELKNKKLGFWYYEQQFLGFNYRMSEIAAALGLSQLKKINKFVKIRNVHAKNYKKLIKDLPVKHQEIILNNKSSYHLFIIILDLKKIKKNYNTIFNSLRKKGVLVNMHYRPIHLQPFYKNKGFKIGNFPIAEQYGKSALSLPLYIDLKFKDQEKIIKILREIIL